MSKYKVCSGCSKELPANADYFHRCKARPDGLRGDCKECRGGKYTNKLNIPKGYKQCNICKEVKPETTDYFYRRNKKLLRGTCIECWLEQSDKYIEDNPKYIIKYRRNYYKENKKRIKKIRRKYYKKNYFKFRKHTNKRRLRKRDIKSDLTNNQWDETLKYFNYSCAYCGMSKEQSQIKYNEALNQDHIVPLSEGGEFTKYNIIPACKGCNSSKHAKELVSWYSGYEYYSSKRLEKIINYINKHSEQRASSN